jgi:hypothetical protein
MDKEIIGHIAKNAIERKKKLIMKEFVKLPVDIGNVKEQNGKRINLINKVWSGLLGVKAKKWGI